jgi:hypothetical protein
MVLWALLGGCAAPGSDLHLAPLYTRTTGPRVPTEHEALGGLIHGREDPRTGTLQSLALRPLFGWRRGLTEPADAPEPHRDWQPAGPGDVRYDFLVPLGFWRREGEVVRSLFAPLWYYTSGPPPGAVPGALRAGEVRREFDLVALPGVFWSRNERGANKLGWFPFYGELDRFLTYEHVRFVLFPLYVSAARDRFTHHHLLFPILGWTWNHEPAPGARPTGPDPAAPRHQFRLWPLFGWNNKPGHWAEFFALWPIFQYRRGELWKPEAEQSKALAALPLIAWKRIGSYRAWSFLWPFFGFAYDPRGARLAPDTEPVPPPPPDPQRTALEDLELERPNPAGPYWAWDGPWPLVRLQGGGRDPAAEERTRLWPFYSHFQGDGLRWRTYAWPFVHSRQEATPSAERASFYVLPFYQALELERRRPEFRPDGEVVEGRASRETWNKLWPLVTSESADHWRRDALLALDPFSRFDWFRYHWSWLWELYAVESQGERVTTRTFLGLYRSQSDGHERRRSFTGLWSRRTTGEGRERSSETSLLFGLLRWRSGPGEDDPGLVRPAFPGPGWPAQWSGEREGTVPDPWSAVHGAGVPAPGPAVP